MKNSHYYKIHQWVSGPTLQSLEGVWGGHRRLFPLGNLPRGNAEATAEHQGLGNYERRAEIPLLAAWTSELHLCWWLPKFSTCETSKRTCPHVAGMGLILTAVGTYTWRLGQTRVQVASIAPTIEWLLHNYCSPGAWPQLICTSVWVKTTSKSHQGQFPTHPQLRWDLEQRQQQWICEPTQRVKEDSNTAYSQVNSSRGGLFHNFSPSGSAPTPPMSHHMLKTDLGGPTPTIMEQTLPLKGSGNHRAKGSPIQYLGQAQSTQHQSNLLSRG